MIPHAPTFEVVVLIRAEISVPGLLLDGVLHVADGLLEASALEFFCGRGLGSGRRPRLVDVSIKDSMLLVVREHQIAMRSGLLHHSSRSINHSEAGLLSR